MSGKYFQVPEVKKPKEEKVTPLKVEEPKELRPKKGKFCTTFML